MTDTSTILIVDDEPLGRETLASLLRGQRYLLVFAREGAEALAQAAALPPDLILLDVMMPSMDGFEVCRRLRADSRLAEVPIILVTALDDRDSRLRGIEAGADDFVTKPFDRVELRARVRTTTRLNRYRRLLRERAKFEWVVEQADEGYVVINARDELRYANPQARRYLGLPLDQQAPIAAAFRALAHKQYHCEPHDAWADWPELPIRTGPVPRYLVRPASAHAEAFWLQVDLLPMAAGSSEHALVRLRDVTTSVITQSSVWSFQALVRHKLSTALNELTGSLRLLVEMPALLSDTQKAEFLEIAEHGATHLQADIQAIFDYMDTANLSQLGQGRCAVAEIAAVITELNARLDLTSITVAYVGLDDPAHIAVAITRRALEVVLWELLENAQKFHPAHTPTLDITIAPIADGIRLQVGDDGRTLAPDQLAQLWRPYYQAERYFTGQVPGMGLGLSTVAALIWGVGGSCQIANRQDGPGIVVTLTLPVARGEAG